jgi:hypothetical protein
MQRPLSNAQAGIQTLETNMERVKKKIKAGKYTEKEVEAKMGAYQEKTFNLERFIYVALHLLLNLVGASSFHLPLHSLPFPSGCVDIFSFRCALRTAFV